MRACIYEDRPSDVVAVKLLVESLLRHCPGLDIEVTVPDAGADTRAWFGNRPTVRFRTDADDKRSGFNAKGWLLQRALDEGVEEPVWVDSDVIVTSDFRSLLVGAPQNAIVVTEETYGVPNQGGTARTRGLGLPVGRRLPNTANTCVLRVTAAHREFLQEWDALLRRPDYLEAQALPYPERPFWYRSDQDLFTGLLGSEQFKDVPIVWLRRGRHVAHCFQDGGVGYNILERVGNLTAGRTPVFLHSCGDRPWRPPNGRPTLHLETSAYTLAAARYELDGGEPAAWTRPSLRGARILRRVFGDGISTVGLLPAIGREMGDQRILKTLVRPLLRRD